MTDNSGRTQGGRFKKGVSGNPAGMPGGTRHRATMMVEKLMQDDAANIVNAILDAARNGDMAAARIVIDRLAPVRKGAPVMFALPPLETAADVARAIGAVTEEMAAGALTPDEASAVAGVLELKRRAIETTDIEARLAKVEKAQAGGSK